MDTPKIQVTEVLWTCEFYGMGGHFKERWVSGSGDGPFEFWYKYDSGTNLERRISRLELEQKGLYEQFLTYMASPPISEDFSHSVLAKGERNPKPDKMDFWDRIIRTE